MRTTERYRYAGVSIWSHSETAKKEINSIGDLHQDKLEVEIIIAFQLRASA